MEDLAAAEPDDDLQIQQILLAASQHDVPQLRILLRNGSASVQDSETGFTPLHAAIAACGPSDSPVQNGIQANGYEDNGHDGGNRNEDPSIMPDDEVQAATKTVKLLLEQGAIWNDVDSKNETPGCLALRLGLKSLYEIMVDAGVRAELLLNRLDEYEQLADGADGDSEGAGVEGSANADDPAQAASTETPLEGHPATETVDEPGYRNEDFLRSSLDFQDDRILDGQRNGVMMAWELDIMKRTVDLLVPTEGLRILNIGHGMGIIDELFQQKAPSAHHVVEAHPAILSRMRDEGWYDKPNITVHEGKWQDVAPKIMEGGQMFDVIYFDTYAEDYKALRNFFSDFVLGLLEDGGKWSFFNGLGADRQICYDVYGKVVEMDLFEAGFDTEWETLQVPDLEGRDEWRAMRRPYWALKEYKLPICSFTG
ncbi:MAG: hypothetical protein Q9191_006911 [Dirinaria sp. TL-2023a]